MIGIGLVNNTDGGDGMTNPPPEVRAKISAKAKARVYPPGALDHLKVYWTKERRAEKAAKQCGKRASNETRARLSAAHAGKIRGPLSEAHREKLKTARPGFRHGEETKARLRILLKGNKNHLGKKHSVEARAKMSKTHSSQRLSPTHRKNIGLALKGRKRPPGVVAKRLATMRRKKQAASNQLSLNL